MTKKVIAITGASGFIGSSLIGFLLQKEYYIIALIRKKESKITASEIRFFDLEMTPDPNLLTGVDILIHCAFEEASAYKNAELINYTGTKQLIDLARLSGVKKNIFFSSLSAHEQARSAYGKSKYRLEQIFDQPQDIVLKSGLVIGNGGLFQKMVQYMLSKRMVPLIDSGIQPLQVIALRDLLRAVHHLIEYPLSGTFTLANTQNLSYSIFFKIVSAHYKKKILFVPFQGNLFLVLLAAAKLLRIALPVSKENVLGLQSLRFFDSQASLDLLRLDPLTLGEALARLSADG